jgi:PadR family transcriptional regulator PadR
MSEASGIVFPSHLLNGCVHFAHRAAEGHESIFAGDLLESVRLDIALWGVEHRSTRVAMLAHARAEVCPNLSASRHDLLLTLYMKCFTPIDIRYKHMNKKIDILERTLHLLILRALAPQPLHGLGVSQRIGQITNQTFEAEPGSLFPALHRMREAGWLRSTWEEPENKRRTEFYSLTSAGRRQLETETRDWARISLGINSALGAA